MIHLTLIIDSPFGMHRSHSTSSLVQSTSSAFFSSPVTEINGGSSNNGCYGIQTQLPSRSCTGSKSDLTVSVANIPHTPTGSSPQSNVTFTTKRHYTMNDESSEDESGGFVKKQKTKKVALSKHNGKFGVLTVCDWF